jgi:hypothetical protein
MVMHASKAMLPVQALGETYEARLAEWGEYTAYFEHIPAGTDFSTYYDRCECPHFGYVFAGKLRSSYPDGTNQIISAGEMYYIPPGHLFHVLEDADTVEFSPTDAYWRPLDGRTEHDDA